MQVIDFELIPPDVPRTFLALMKLSCIFFFCDELPQFGPDLMLIRYFVLSVSNSRSIPTALDFLPPNAWEHVKIAIFSMKLPKTVSSPEDTVASIIDFIKSLADVSPFALNKYGFFLFVISDNFIALIFSCFF